MVDSLGLLQSKVDKANFLLKKKKTGVTIYIRKDGFFLRSYLPPKSNPKSKDTIQQWVPISLKATARNIKEASRLAEKLGAERIAGLFRWEEWLEKEEEAAKPKEKSRKVGDIRKAFKENYFKDPKHDINNESTLKGWNHIEGYLKRMENHKILNLENIISLAEQYPHGSKSRFEIAKQFLRLYKFSELPNLNRVSDWCIATQQQYQPKIRDRLSDEEYLYHVRLLREDSKFGWALAAMFVFGCRITEVWSLVPYEKDGKILAKILTVNKSKKPSKYRGAIALEQEWAKSLNILDVYKEYEINSPQEYNGKEVKSVNDRFHKWLRTKTNRAFQLTDLRGAYGFRTANKNISTANAAQWMGHSQRVHTDTYQQGYNESYILRVAESMDL